MTGIDKMTDSGKTEHTSGTLPWTRSCFVCGQDNPYGLRLKSRVENDCVVLTYMPRERDLGWRQIIHGGISMTLLDEVMTWAAILAVRKACVAAEMSVRLKAAIGVGSNLRVEGRVVRATSRIVFTEGSIKNEQGEEMIVAAGKYMPMSEEQMSLCADDFVISSDSIHPDSILSDKKTMS